MIQTIYQQLKYNPVVVLIFGVMMTWLIERILDQFSQRRLAPLWLLGLFAIVVVVVLLYRLLLWLFHRHKDNAVSPKGTLPPPRRGLILLYGREETARKALLPHRDDLEFIWFIVTGESEPKLDALPNHWWGRGADSEEMVHDVFNPLETANAVERALSHAQILGLGPGDLACDVTGGTKAMSIGAVSACSAHPDLVLQMVEASYDTELGRPRALDAIRIEIGRQAVDPGGASVGNFVGESVVESGVATDVD